MQVNPKFIEENKIIVRHYRTEKNGAVTVCAKRPHPYLFEIGVAFCAPSERQFSKEHGKAIALGRLLACRNRGYAMGSIRNGIK